MRQQCMRKQAVDQKIEGKLVVLRLSHVLCCLQQQLADPSHSLVQLRAEMQATYTHYLHASMLQSPRQWITCSTSESILATFLLHCCCAPVNLHHAADRPTHLLHQMFDLCCWHTPAGPPDACCTENPERNQHTLHITVERPTSPDS